MFDSQKSHQIKQRRKQVITTAHKEWEELQEIMTKEKPTQFAVVFDKGEQEWQYSRPAKFVAV